MKKRMPLPKVWKDCPDWTGDFFEIKCTMCLKDSKVQKSLFMPDSNAVLEGLEFSGFQSSYFSKSSATIANLIAAVLTVIAVFTFLPPGRIGRMGSQSLQGAVYLVGIPVLVWWRIVLRWLFSRRMRIWKYKCSNCGHDMIVVSNGKSAAFGSVERPASLGKAGAKESVGGRGGGEVEGKALDTLILDLFNKDAGTRERAAGALAGIDAPRKIAPLIEALKDKEPRVRKRVALTLVKVRNKKAIESLFSQSQTDGERGVRGHIRGLIANEIRGIRPARAILKGMENSDPKTRDLAYEAFLNQQDSRALETLIQAMKAPS